MKSVRLDDRQERRLEEVARVTGESVSEVIRTAIDRHCDSVLSDRLDQRLADVIGSVEGGGDSRKTGRAFTELLSERARKE